jgi:hypothetical protein
MTVHSSGQLDNSTGELLASNSTPRFYFVNCIAVEFWRVVMQRLAFILAAAMPLTLAVPAMAGQATQAQSTEQAPPAAKANPYKKEVCQTVTSTGTRTRKRVCRTIEDWVNEQARATGEDLGTKSKGFYQLGTDTDSGLGGAPR